MSDKTPPDEPQTAVERTSSDCLDEPPRPLAVDPPTLKLPIAPIGRSLKAPILPTVKNATVSRQQAYDGVVVHIPGSIQMRPEDLLVFYWGRHRCCNFIYNEVRANSIVRLMCISYTLIEQVEFGELDLYYEVYRADQLIGTSPSLSITVHY